MVSAARGHNDMVQAKGQVRQSVNVGTYDPAPHATASRTALELLAGISGPRFRNEGRLIA